MDSVNRIIGRKGKEKAQHSKTTKFTLREMRRRREMRIERRREMQISSPAAKDGLGVTVAADDGSGAGVAEAVEGGLGVGVTVAEDDGWGRAPVRGGARVPPVRGGGGQRRREHRRWCAGAGQGRR
jgi:hypothetical protein